MWGIRLDNHFDRLKRKIFVQVLLTALLALVIGWIILTFLVDGILQDAFADFFVSFMTGVFSMSNEMAQGTYYSIFQRYKAVWLCIGFVILLLVIFYGALTRFTRYFDEINKGVDELLDERKDQIALLPELDVVQEKMNEVKRILEKRTQIGRAHV